MNDRLELLLTGPLVMAASLHAATEVWRRRVDRLRGRDDSSDEPEDQARELILEALEVLSDLAFRAAASEVAAERADPSDAGEYVRHFDGLLRLNRSAGLLEECHRRLLTLYPSIPAELVEQARCISQATRQAVEDDGAMDHRAVRDFIRSATEVLCA